MIKVNRSLLSPPAALTGPGSLGVRETKKVCAYFELPTGTRGKAPKPDAYSHLDVKRVLTSLFGGKCAYCESRYASTQPMDVEHYRPKRGVYEHPAHPGYYWLGATWENLLPSCIDCNREREHDLPAAPGATPAMASSGKHCKFPLLSEQQRVTVPGGDLTQEQPILLDPCIDDPTAFLLFGNDAVVRPKAASGTPARQRAEGTIAVLGLNRPGLVHARLETLRLLQAHMLVVERLTKLFDTLRPDSPQGILVEDLLAHELATLDEFSLPARPYSQMCSQVTAGFISRLRGGPLPQP